MDAVVASWKVLPLLLCRAVVAVFDKFKTVLLSSVPATPYPDPTGATTEGGGGGGGGGRGGIVREDGISQSGRKQGGSDSLGRSWGKSPRSGRLAIIPW